MKASWAKGERLAARRGVGNAIILDRRPKARAGAVLLAVGLAGLLAACSRGGDWRAPANGAESGESRAGYVAPPRFTAAARLGDGRTEIVGRAVPNARVRLASPDGAIIGAVTDSRGAFSVAIPAATGVRLFGLSESVANRPIQGEGYLALLPSPGRAAVLLRAGIGAEALEPAPTSLTITAVDFDSGGGAVVSGLALPNTPLKLSIDGTPGGDARSDAEGHFSFALAAALKPGDHMVVVQSASGEARVRFDVGPAGPISGLPFRGERQAGDWRIDWLTPSGGEQTTLVMD